MKASRFFLSGLVLLFALSAQAEVVKQEVQTDGLVADFYSNGSLGEPCILFLGGSEGGRPHPYLPQLCAENGFPVLAVAYFKETGLPDTLQMVPLEYFDKAFKWMDKNFPHSAIAVVGASKGAELALLLASKIPSIEGVIAISPSSVVWDGIPKAWWPPDPKSSWSVKAEPVPFVPYDYGKGYAVGDPQAIFNFYKQSLTQKEAVEKAAIKVEKISGSVLLASGNDDTLWPSGEMADAIIARLKETAFKHSYEHLRYENAGHTLNEFSMMGGTAEGNKQARVELEKKLLAFLKAIQDSHR